MLFAVKRRPGPALLLFAVFVVVALGAQTTWVLTWRWEFTPFALVLASAVLGTSDALLHGTLTLALGESYTRCYRTLVDYFRPQRVPAILAGALLAGGEELVFRGSLLEGLRGPLGLPDVAAVAIVALVFGLLHAIPVWTLLPFTLWAVWEGALLGTVYVLTDSLGAVVVLHVLHDLTGFSLFAYQRRTGWLLGGPLSPVARRS